MQEIYQLEDDDQQQFEEFMKKFIAEAEIDCPPEKLEEDDD